MKYVWKVRPIVFNGLARAGAGKEVIEFENKEAFDKWFRKTTIGLAELDEAMNFCKYFVREKGNKGRYERDGKSFPVDGSWVGIQDFDSNYPPTQPFVRWLEENGWRKNWFELMDRYKK